MGRGNKQCWLCVHQIQLEVTVSADQATAQWTLELLTAYGQYCSSAQVMTHLGLLNALQEHVRFARARFGTYDTIDLAY